MGDMPLDRIAASQTDLGLDLEFYSNLLDRRTVVLSRIRELEAYLDDLNTLIDRHERSASRSKAKSPRQLKQVRPKQPRVRGVLAAARKAIEQLPGPFNKKQLLDVIKMDQELAGKKISDANIRNALRILTNKGVIRVANSATPITCAKYIKAS